MQLQTQPCPLAGPAQLPNSIYNTMKTHSIATSSVEARINSYYWGQYLPHPCTKVPYPQVTLHAKHDHQQPARAKASCVHEKRGSF